MGSYLRVREIVDSKLSDTNEYDLPKDDLQRMVKEFERQMKHASSNLEFEKAAILRDQIVDLRKLIEDGLS